MLRRLQKYVPRLASDSKSRPSASDAAAGLAKVQNEFPSEDYPSFPPPPPQQLLRDKETYWSAVQRRKFAAPQGCSGDEPLYALYRLYEAVVLDKVTTYRNILEYFWRKPTWLVCKIPTPAEGGDGQDAARLAMLAGITHLMVESFNARVELGLVRGGHPLMSYEDRMKAKDVPMEERSWEHIPAWAAEVAPLEDLLTIPTEEGEALEDVHDKRAQADFLKLNILLWTPHIHFT